jgi:hypothetical protein
VYSTFLSARMTNGRAVGLGDGWQRLENRRELAEAFMARPWGPHGSAVQAIVNAMRSAPVAVKFAVRCLVPYETWVLVRLPRRRGLPLERVDERIFTSLVEAERAVFAQRWEALFGERLDPYCAVQSER